MEEQFAMIPTSQTRLYRLPFGVAIWGPSAYILAAGAAEGIQLTLAGFAAQPFKTELP